MKARTCLAGAAALALAVAVATVPTPARAAPASEVPARDLYSPFAHTAIGAVFDANDGRVPANGEELVKALAKLGDFVQLPVPFSAVAMNSGLTHPRVVIALRPSTTPKPERAQGGWSGKPVAPTTPPPQPLNEIAANRTQLQGRLFLAANTELADNGIKVRTVEFISWNTRKLKFDFGVIEGLGTGETPEVKVLDGLRCFSCHKGRGPILGGSPWSNTSHNKLVRATAAELLARPIKLPGGNEIHDPSQDGLTFHDPHAPEIDAAVRFGGDLLRDRAIFKQLAENDEGRKGLVLLLEAVTAKGALEKCDKELAPNLNALNLARFARNATTARFNAAPSTLRDFSPAGPVNRPVPAGAAGAQSRYQVVLYDAARATGRPRLPSEFLPSNPKAFAPPQVKATQVPAEAVSAVLLAQTLGLSEKDRAFLAGALDGAVEELNDPARTRAAVAHAIFTGPAFADVLATGALPDRDDFKDRFVAGLVAVLRSQKGDSEFWLTRDAYTSAPKFDPFAKPEKELVPLPSHACLACHDVRSTGRVAFNPIPALAFDPYDATARDAWLKGADRTRKAEVLGRMLKRIAHDQDMPPVDSVEADLYRAKDPTALNAVRDWLDAELKKLK